jgi:hypothetical protein
LLDGFRCRRPATAGGGGSGWPRPARGTDAGRLLSALEGPQLSSRGGFAGSRSRAALAASTVAAAWRMAAASAAFVSSAPRPPSEPRPEPRCPCSRSLGATLHMPPAGRAGAAGGSTRPFAAHHS